MNTIDAYMKKRARFFATYKKSFQAMPDKDFEKLIDMANDKSSQAFDMKSISLDIPAVKKNHGSMEVIYLGEDRGGDQDLIFYLHGGGYISGPIPDYFKALEYLIKRLGVRAILPIYPKASLYTYKDAYREIFSFYKDLLTEGLSSDKIHLMGDSAGGGLALGFAMYLRDQGFDQPKHTIMYSPWLDLNTDNPDIKDYEDLDPMLAPWGSRKIGRLWAGSDEDMKNPYASPIFGDFEGLGRLSIFVGTKEIFYPDCLKFHKVLEEKNIDHDFEVGQGLPHIYPIFPAVEGYEALDKVCQIIKDEA